MIDEGAGGRWSEARRVAHWAAQIVAAAGKTLVAPAPDHSNTSLEWLEPAHLIMASRSKRRRPVSVAHDAG